MLTTSRLIQVASLLSLIAAGCGGGSNNADLGPDAAGTIDSGGKGPGADGAVTPTPEAGTPDASGTSDATTGAPDGTICSVSTDCQNAHCISGICCASACDAPAACQTATGATCTGGATCAYPNAADSTACDDHDGCTKTDVCTGGQCVGSGAVSCDDGNICTTDTCVSPGGCVHDGTGVVTAGCMTGDMCTSYVCHGDKAGTCDVASAKDCSASNDQCNTGVCNPTTGACSKQATNEADACDDANACTTGETCHSGTCGSGTTVNCNDGNPCTDDSCDTVLGCKSHNNTVACDDGNPCTVSDTCASGLCQGSPKDCSGQNDACNTGVCNAGTCGKSPKANNTPCDDGLACNTNDVCTTGACHGSGNSCGANSTGCTEGPKVCTCSSGFVSSGGQCVPATNECAANPCVQGATCNDPSSAANDYVCTCPTGFTGDGKTAGTGCTNINDCVGNPCGAGLGTCVDGINAHTCNCNAGYVSVGGTCVCDMNGTFAVQSTLATSWPEVTIAGIHIFEAATNVSTKQWAIRTETYDSTGTLVIKTTQCGGTTADLCGETSPINDAYAEFIPSTVYGLPSMPVSSLTITLASPLPGHAYTEPQSATLLGISLTDPLGAWPAAAANVGAGANQTNGAIWVDSDNDSFAGVTSYAVPPGGIAHTTSPFPIQDYAAASTVCLRSSDAGPRLSYNYLPAGITAHQVKRLYTGQRVISSMSGTITTCDATGATLIQGTLGGPDASEPRIDARVDGCVRVSGSGEADCASSVVNQYDGQGQTDHISSASFVLKRVANTATCADVRAMTFP